MKTAVSTRAIKPGPGARCLYLGSREHKRVSCTAEALVVTNASAQTLRYPVARVARVVSSADVVDWSGPALALCMRAGIGITWLDSRGQAVGSIYPQTRSTASLATVLELWSEREDGPERYQNWLKRCRMDILVRWRESQLDSVSPQQWESTKREWVYNQTFAVHLPTTLRSLCLAYVASQLASYGLTPQLWGPRIENIDLDEDLCELLWAEMNLATGALADNAAGAAAVTALFERWTARNASALTVHLACLHRTALKAMHQ
ncbi:CRISPR-associated endonuclease Cas1 [Rhodoferax antarcticus]|uniref:Uncharacterized protein n=1 Tax=Rhodoferax antarcticus ANT.BR TaxID=1111071 RepID=A0A1Q8YES8_9BURK|nr:CRISPR-associated endonuclease Cas1 [Rhodoferax antarcticus]APW46310.1 hypothetical protein RA876_07890 [Rhodoferax antarcticus]OLP06526.1 hypothetical protein BLL52_2762 [Rhodoferax antarcticus ANT.BR]